MPKTKKERCPISEFTIFTIFFGLILGALGYHALTGISKNAPPLFGMNRSLAFGFPLLAIGLGFTASGVWLKITKDKTAIYLAVLCGVALLLGDLVIELGIFGKLFAFKLISIVIYALPFILISRVKPAIERIAQLKAQATEQNG